MQVNEKIRLKGITGSDCYETGELKDCRVSEYNTIEVNQQSLVPRYRELNERNKDTKALSFYKSGGLKSIYLEEQTDIKTPIGEIPAELVTFYEDGNIDSIFPLNGQIGFGWSLKDEEKLLKPLFFNLPWGSIEAKIIGLRFYNGGKIKSIILWPKEVVKMQTPLGLQSVRVGFRLYEDGALESFEPARPIAITTRIGEITAFDQNAIGVDADFNSVRFYPDGKLLSLSTNSDIVIINKISGKRDIIYQQMRFEMTSDKMMKVPVKIVFENDVVMIDNGVEKEIFSIEESRFLFLYDGSYIEKKCSPGSDCSGCGASCM